MRCQSKILLSLGAYAALTVVGVLTSAAGILATTTNALPGYQGTRSFTDGPLAPPFLNDEVTADVDFVVFAPETSGTDTFDQFLAEFGISISHSVPTDHYVYAYQVDVIDADPASHLFTVGTMFSGVLGGSAPSFIPVADYGNGGIVNGNGDEDPTGSSYQGGTSALWEFKTSSGSSFDGNLDSGEWSGILYFSSSHSPTWDSAQVTSGIASAKSTPGENYPLTGLAGTGVPTPAPEPSSLILLGIAVCLAISTRTRRSDIC